MNYQPARGCSASIELGDRLITAGGQNYRVVFDLLVDELIHYFGK